MLVMQYQSEHAIAFDFSKNQLMVNATEMGKPFGKSPKDFLRTQSAQEYITAFSARLKCLPTDLVQVVNGGNNFGTWFHQKIALRFAQWLSPEFAIWVDEKIEELLTKGRTEIAPASPLSLARQMLEAMEMQEQRITTVESTVKRIEAKVTNINDDYFSISGWYRMAVRQWDLSNTEAQQLGKRLAKESAMNGFTVHKVHDAKYGLVNTYHKDVLKSVLGFGAAINSL